jgi:hypothetical protein
MLFLGFKVVFDHRVHYSKAIVSVCYYAKVEVSCFSFKHNRETFVKAFLRDSDLITVVVVDIDLSLECLIVLPFILNVILVVIDLY